MQNVQLLLLFQANLFYDHQNDKINYASYLLYLPGPGLTLKFRMAKKKVGCSSPYLLKEINLKLNCK